MPDSRVRVSHGHSLRNGHSGKTIERFNQRDQGNYGAVFGYAEPKIFAKCNPNSIAGWRRLVSKTGKKFSYITVITCFMDTNQLVFHFQNYVSRIRQKYQDTYVRPFTVRRGLKLFLEHAPAKNSQRIVQRAVANQAKTWARAGPTSTPR